MELIPVIIIFGYVLLLYAVTWATRRRSRGGMIAYLLAGRGLPAWITAAMLTGLAVGGASTIGVAERAYTHGLSAGWYNAAWAAGAFLMGLFAAGRYRRLEVNTLPELFERCYSTTGRIIGVAGQLVIHLVITSLQYVAGGAILSSLLPDFFSFHTGMLVTAVVFVGITLIGGFWAAGLTNVINVTLIYIGVVAGAIMAVTRVGGLEAMAVKIPAGHPGFDLGAVGMGLIAAWFMVMCTQVFSTQAVVQISFAAKNRRSARLGFLLGGLIILPVGFISALIGIAATVLEPGIIPTEALPRTVLGLNPLVAGLILAGLWAADVSTASALLLGSSTLVVGDLVKRFIAPDLSERGERLISKVTVLVMSIATYLLAISVKGILKTLLVGLTLTTAYTLVTLMTLYLPRLCRRSSATATLLATMGALVCWMLFPMDRYFTHPIYFTWLASIAAFFLVTIFDTRRITPP